MHSGMIWNPGSKAVPAVLPGINKNGIHSVPFVNNGGAMAAEISENSLIGIKHDIDLHYIDNVQQNANIMGFKYDLNTVEKDENNFILPEYFKLNPDYQWHDLLRKEKCPLLLIY